MRRGIDSGGTSTIDKKSTAKADKAVYSKKEDQEEIKTVHHRQ